MDIFGHLQFLLSFPLPFPFPLLTKKIPLIRFSILEVYKNVGKNDLILTCVLFNHDFLPLKHELPL